MHLRYLISVMLWHGTRYLLIIVASNFHGLKLKTLYYIYIYKKKLGDRPFIIASVSKMIYMKILVGHRSIEYCKVGMENERRIYLCWCCS
jgi:hypothetical protein